MFTLHRGDFRAGARSLQFPLMALQNVTPARVIQAWVHLRAFSILRNRLTRSLGQTRVHPGCCTGERISPRNQTSQRYSVNAKRLPVSVWNRSTGGPEGVWPPRRRPLGFVRHAIKKWMRDERTPKDVCGEAGTGRACVMFTILNGTCIYQHGVYPQIGPLN